MNRRAALRAATALAAGGVAAGCGTSARDPAAAPASPAPATAPSEKTVPAKPVLPAEITHGPRDSPKVALTFHGQGEAFVVGRLLDEIAKDGARVTVLAVGTWLAAQPGLGRRIVAAGHELGNHTQHHADIARMTAGQAHAEIDACARTLRTVTGSIGRWFRPSQTRHATATIRSAAARVGYPTCLSYDVDSLDFTDPGARAVVDTTLTAVRAGSIVSLHCGHAGTVAAMGPLLRGLRGLGLTPVTVTELMR